MDEQNFSAGHVFFQPGDPGDLAYLVHAGRVEILTGPPSTYRRVNEYGPEDVFGEMSLVEERPRSMTARAVTDGRVTPLARADFERMLIADPARCQHYLRSLFEKLRSLSSRVSEQGQIGEFVSGDASRDLVPVTPSIQTTPHSGPYDLPTGEHGQAMPDGWSVVLLPLTRQAAKTLPDEGIRISRSSVSNWADGRSTGTRIVGFERRLADR